MSDELSFDYIIEVGKNVRNIYENNDDQKDWFDNALEENNMNGEYREGFLDEIINYLFSFNDNDYDDLANELIEIRRNDGDENILNYIFYNDDSSKTPTKTPSMIPSITTSTSSSLDTKLVDESIPIQYFNKKIQDIVDFAKVSADFAYLLAKKFDFNIQKIKENWISNSDEILSSLKISNGSEKSLITFTKIGVDECPICCETGELYELYCGDIMCKNCLLSEIEPKMKARKVFTCPCNCGVEILPHDVCEIIKEDPEKVKKYSEIVMKSQIEKDEEVRQCQCCDSLITPAHYISFSVGRCKNCSFATCIKCHKGYHGPLSCARMDDFFDEKRKKMKELEDDQESWFAREKRLQGYRRENKEPVFAYFNNLIAETKQKVEKEKEEEIKKINEYKKELNKITQELNSLSIQEKSPTIEPSKHTEIVNKIESLREDLRRTDYLLNSMKESHEKNNRERNKEVNDADDEKEYFINAVSNPKKYDYFIDEYKRHTKKESYKNLNIQLTDEEFIAIDSKRCPKCGIPITKTTGCFLMTCICGFRFCYHCNEPWFPNHDDHHSCPYYKQGKSSCGINFNDMNDKKFYPPPMNTQTRKEFARFSTVVGQYKKAKEKLEQIENQFRATNDEVPNKSIYELNYIELTPKNRLIKSLMKSTSENNAKIFADKIINTLIYGQKTVMFGLVHVFYISNLNGNVVLFEYHSKIIEKHVDQLLHMINNSATFNYADFETIIKQIDSDVRVVSDDAMDY